MNDGAKLGLWLVGVITVVMLMEYVPRVGGAILLLLVVYLASQAMQKGVV